MQRLQDVQPGSRYRSAVGFLAFCALVFLLAGVVSTGEVEAGKKKAKPKPEKPHLDYRRTYEQALYESRIRNLPTFVSRHKDF